MKLLAVIVNYNVADLALKSLEYLINAIEFADCSYKIVVVDNHSTAEDRDTLINGLKITEQNNPDIELLLSDVNGGYGFGNNLAINKYMNSDFEPDYIYILNPDGFPDQNAIEEMIKFMEQFPDTGITGSHLYSAEMEDVTAFRFPTVYSEFENAIRFSVISKLLKNYTVSLGIQGENCHVDWVTGASLLLKVRMLMEIGLFDEKFFLYFEETDLSKRALEAGWKTAHVRSSHVMHIGSASTGQYSWERIPSYWLDSRNYYFIKQHGKIYRDLCNIARLTGGLLGKLKQFVLNKPDTSLEAPPRKFHRDLFIHWIRNW